MRALVISVSKFLAFVLGLGWSAHYYLITEIKGQINEKTKIFEREKERDVGHINSKLKDLSENINRVDAKTDRIIDILIKGKKHD